MRLTFLGTGTSHGLPYVGCECAVCTSDDLFNKRGRCSIIVESDDGETRLLVDTPPDLRTQFLREKLSRISAVLWTHTHNDHVIGLDDLRPVTDICGYTPGYATESTLAHLHNIFGYAFVQEREHGGFPRLTGHIITPGKKFHVGGIDILPITIVHGKAEIVAYRFEQGGKSLMYATDCSFIPDDSWQPMAGADVLVLDALRHRPHPTHFCVEQSIEASQRLEPGRTLFTHIAHDLDHKETSAMLPEGIEIAYDGLRVDI